MIPTIETIVMDLGAGDMPPREAINWIHRHVLNAKADMRDHFAGQALAGLNLLKIARTPEWQEAIAWDVYSVADAMLKARENDHEHV